MKRLTMKDENGCFLTDKTATVTWNSLIGENRYRGEAVDRFAAIEDILGDEYELDAVAWVVRCKNCRYYRDAKINEKGFLICPASGMEITENDFCSYGESPKVAMKARELDEQYLL